MKTFGDNLRQVRQSLGLSQFQLAEKIGCRAKDISRWETNVRQPNLISLQKLIKALDTTFEELMDGVN